MSGWCEGGEKGEGACGGGEEEGVLVLLLLLLIIGRGWKQS